MDGPGPRDRPVPQVGSESTSRTVTADISRQPTRTDSAEAAENSDKRTDGQLEHEVSYSKPIYIEPPPVVQRPPKIKNDSFSITSSWFAWDRTEQHDGWYCARSMHKLYAYTTNIRLFGISVSKKIAVEFSSDGINSAQEVVRMGNQEWRKDRLNEAKRRLGKYTHNQSKEIDASRRAGDSQLDLERKAAEGQNEQQHVTLHQHPYVMVGFMGDESVPKETLRRVLDSEHLFRELHHAHRHLRKPHRRILSLKECAGFGIYECDPVKGYHREIVLDRETERALTELWRSYCGHKLDYEGRWLTWIHENFNNGSNNPEEGRLTLEFKLRWSVTKVVFWGVVPVLLSLAIGFWYMYGADHGDVTDPVVIAEAAWVISTYIITTSALLLALLAVISQFGDI